MENKLHQLILSLLVDFPQELGTIQEIYETDDPRFIVVYEDDPASPGTRFSIASSLLKLQKADAIQLVGSEGASGIIDTSLIVAFPIAEVRLKTAEFFVKELKISAVEFCDILLEGKFLCHGVEDPELYQQALKLFREGNHYGVNMLGYKRAPVLVENLLGLMLDNQVLTAALPVCGNLPPLVCEELKRLELSYAWIKPNPSGSRDWERYVNVIGGDSIVGSVQIDLCLFCGTECEAPFLQLSDGGIVGFKCFINFLNSEVIPILPNEELAKTSEIKCFICQMPPARAYYQTPIGSLCLPCLKSELDIIKKVINSPLDVSTANEFTVPRFIPWIHINNQDEDVQDNHQD